MKNEQTVPKVSVQLASYNSKKFIEETISSVVAQTFEDWELIVVDDASTDGSLDLIRGFAAKDARIRVFTNSKNMGMGFNYSLMISKSAAVYIAQIGHDDVWERDFLSESVKHLDLNTDCAAVFTQVQIIDQNGKPYLGDTPFRMETLAALSREQLLIELIRSNFLCAGAAVLRRDHLNGWHTLGDSDLLHDWNTWLRVILFGRIDLINKALFRYRIHGGNQSLSTFSPGLLRVESRTIRMQLLCSAMFWNFILSAKSGDVLLNSVLESYVAADENDFDGTMRALLYAMRAVEHRFRDSAVFSKWLGYCLWYEGAFIKALKYLEKGEPQSLPRWFDSQMTWRWFLIRAPKANYSRADLFKYINFGFYLLVMIKVPRSKDISWSRALIVPRNGSLLRRTEFLVYPRTTAVSSMARLLSALNRKITSRLKSS